VGVLRSILRPRAVEQAAVEGRHVVIHQHDGGPLGVKELGEGLVVGPRRFQGHDDLRHPRSPLVALEPPPEGREAGRGVREGHGRLQDPGVREPDLGDVGGLRHVDANQEPVPASPEIRLQLPNPRDSRAVVSHAGHGAPPSGAGTTGRGDDTWLLLYRSGALLAS